MISDKLTDYSKSNSKDLYSIQTIRGIYEYQKAFFYSRHPIAVVPVKELRIFVNSQSVLATLNRPVGSAQVLVTYANAGRVSALPVPSSRTIDYHLDIAQPTAGRYAICGYSVISLHSIQKLVILAQVVIRLVKSDRAHIQL